VKGKIAFWSSALANSILDRLLLLVIFCIPLQLGKHFWPDSAYLLGRKVDYLSPTMYLSDAPLVFAGALALLCYHKALLAGLRRHVSIQAFLLLSGVSMMLAISPLTALYSSAKTLLIVLFSYALAQRFHTIRGNVAAYFAIGIGLSAALAIAQSISHQSVGGLFYWLGERTFSSTTPGIANASINGQLVLRPYAAFPHPNVLASYLFCGIVMLCEQVFNLKKISLRSAAMIVLIIVAGIAQLMTLSRVAIVVTVCYLIIRAGMASVGTTKMQSAKLTFGLLFLFIVGLFVYQYRFVPAIDTAATERIELVKKSLALITKSPLLGVGQHNYLYALAADPPLRDGIALLQPVHNVLLLLLVQIGIPASMLVLLFLWKTVKRVVSLARDGNTMASFLFFGMLILGMADHYFLTLQQGQLLAATLFGIYWQREKASRVPLDIPVLKNLRKAHQKPEATERVTGIEHIPSPIPEKYTRSKPKTIR
jgi:O-antigen ligase